MYTTSTVKEIKNDNLVIVSCASEACAGCKAQMFCNNRDNTEYTARNDKGLELKPGTEVQLFLPPGKTVLSTFLVFALPLILFPAGYLLMKNLTPCNELVCALGGLGAMAVAFAAASIINIKNKKALMPVITKVLE